MGCPIFNFFSLGAIVDKDFLDVDSVREVNELLINKLILEQSHVLFSLLRDDPVVLGHQEVPVALLVSDHVVSCSLFVPNIAFQVDLVNDVVNLFTHQLLLSMLGAEHVE